MGGSVLAAVLVLVCWLAASQIPQWRLEREIRRFEAAPSQALADKLMERLTGPRVTTEQGERILRLLLEPKITKRESYQAGKPAGIGVELPFRLESKAKMRLCRRIEGAPETLAPEPQRWTTVLTTEPQILLVPSPSQPLGIHKCAVYSDVRYTFTRDRPSTWDQWRRRVLRAFGRSSPPGHTPNKAYHCRFAVPVEVNFVEKGAAEQMELVSGGRIDETMRRIVAVDVQADRHGAFETAAGRRGVRGCPSITFQALPIAAGWQVSLRLEDDREFPTDNGTYPQKIHASAGSYGHYMVDLSRLGIEEPGEYSGTLVLRPDPDHAYEDPGIKSLWNGTLEFPVSFVVYVKTNAR
jgi:hypothetical protein